MPDRRHRGGVLRSLTGRAVLAGCLIALISVLVTALVAVPLALRSANGSARKDLAARTELTAGIVGLRPANAGEERVANQLRQQGIELYLIRNGQADRPGLPARFTKQIAAGLKVSGIARVDGQAVMVEGRPLANGTKNGVVLTQPAGTGVVGAVLKGLWLALLAGLLAGAAAGILIAGRLARPIRHAATAAARLSAGDRSVRLHPEPPAEVEDLAHALNGLAAALITSEGRQRDFLLSVSHELRTPLTTLKGYAEALSDGVIGPDGAQRAGTTMLGEAEHLDRLVTDLLALARLEAVDFPLSVLDVNLVELVGAAAEAWRTRCASAGLVLSAHLPPVPVIARTDPGRIRQVLDGLLENALRVVPAGAPVTLALYPPDRAGLATVEVRDGGPGLSEDDLAVAFDRGALHQRYRGVREVGTGLGLALAAGLVRRLGGTIAAGHAPEGGARFTIRLPVLVTIPPPPAPTRPS